jgi:small subunit ribosomal protein S4
MALPYKLSFAKFRCIERGNIILTILILFFNSSNINYNPFNQLNMSKYIGPKLRITRRLGQLRGLTRKKTNRRVLNIENEQGFITKKIVIPPGQHGRTKCVKSSRYNTSKFDYLIRLKVKQRLRFNYGLTERQLVAYVRKAKKIKEATGQVLLQFIEMRLDNIVFRLNMGPTIVAARQLINHGHILVNNQKVNIPSYVCQPKDVISVTNREKSLKLVTKNLSLYYKRIQFLRNFYKKTIGFVLSSKMKAFPSIASVLQFIREGRVSIRNRKRQKRKAVTKKIWRANYICQPGTFIQVATKNGIIQLYIPKKKSKNSKGKRKIRYNKR